MMVMKAPKYRGGWENDEMSTFAEIRCERNQVDCRRPATKVMRRIKRTKYRDEGMQNDEMSRSPEIRQKRNRAFARCWEPLDLAAYGGAIGETW